MRLIFSLDLVLSVYLSEQHLPPLLWKTGTSCSSLPPPYSWSNHYKALLILFLSEKEMTEDEMAGWHRWLDGRESEWTPGVGDGQGGLACCGSWGRKELDTTERLNWTELNWSICLLRPLPFGSTALRLLTSITFCKNKGLLIDLSHPFHRTFHMATIVTLTKSQMDNVPSLLQIVQRPPMVLRTQATLLCTFSHPHKVLAFASYVPHKACHPPLYLSKSIFIGKRISPVPSPKHDWGCAPVREKELRQIILLFFGWYLMFNVFF